MGCIDKTDRPPGRFRLRSSAAKSPSDTSGCRVGRSGSLENESPVGDFKADIDRHIRDLRASRPGLDRIRIPGEGG